MAVVLDVVCDVSQEDQVAAMVVRALAAAQQVGIATDRRARWSMVSIKFANDSAACQRRTIAKVT